MKMLFCVFFFFYYFLVCVCVSLVDNLFLFLSLSHVYLRQVILCSIPCTLP
jgi:hypothetical protein